MDVIKGDGEQLIHYQKPIEVESKVNKRMERQENTIEAPQNSKSVRSPLLGVGREPSVDD
jgi:hypothetical protein